MCCSQQNAIPGDGDPHEEIDAVSKSERTLLDHGQDLLFVPLSPSSRVEL
jgi:hypothetical protein